MKYALLTLSIVLCGGLPAIADVEVDVDFDSPHEWQVLVNLAALRERDAGKPLYGWLRREVFDDIESEIEGVEAADLNEIWAHGVEKGFVAAFDGPLASEVRSRIESAHGGGAEGLERRDEDGTAVYSLSAGSMVQLFASHAIEHFGMGDHSPSDEMELAFTADDRAVVGTGAGSAANAATRMASRPVIANDVFLQVSVGRAISAVTGKAPSGPWDSSVFKRVSGVDLTLAEADSESLDLNLQLKTDSDASAKAITDILNGVMGLYALSGDDDPEVSALMNGLSIRAADSAVSIRNTLATASLVQLLD